MNLWLSVPWHYMLAQLICALSVWITAYFIIRVRGNRRHAQWEREFRQRWERKDD